MSTIDVVIKSYKRDYWLLYIALDTFKRNVIGYSNLVLLIPEIEKHEFDTRKLPPRTLVHYVNEYGSGYMFQQVCKLNAHKYSNADFIMFSDSDCLFSEPINLQDYIKDGKPEILFTDYAKVEQAVCWKAPTESLLGEKVKWEFMRRNSLIYHRSTLQKLNEWKPDLEEIVMSSHTFSEFNLIGAWANKYQKELYTWTNTDEWEYVPPKSLQVWSLASKEPGADELHLREYIRVLESIMTCFNVPVPNP